MSLVKPTSLFRSGFEFRIFLLLDWLTYKFALLFTHSWRVNSWIHTFPQGISIMWNANSFDQDLNWGCRVHFLQQQSLYYATSENVLITLTKALDCGLEVRKFKIQSCYYVHFWERYETPYFPSYGLNSTITVVVVYILTILRVYKYTREHNQL